MSDRESQEETRYEALRLCNQLCFPLYACSKEIVRRYTPLLKPLDLTYTQYLVMMALWEKKVMRFKELGELLYLDSGTLTPLIKRLAEKNYIRKTRSESDARDLVLELTEEGLEMREKAVGIPEQVGSCIDLEKEEALTLYEILHKIMKEF
ncbi:MAG: MarR family transcriptional regulator [Sphaerochaetaceae bacterium]|nr:MarR family transcriptional regulator [Sphaerochaetaceae bacterium]